MSSRRPFFAANWKMNLRRADVGAYAAGLAARLAGRDAAEVVLFPPFPLLAPLASALAGTSVGWGGQDLHPEDTGAHTGDVSALHLLDWGSTWVLCGHSERRADHREGDDLVAAKVRQANKHGLKPLLCLGETGAERERGETEAVLARQLRAAAPAGAPAGDWALAYEPVWAIGTGRTATPELAQEAHAFLRRQAARILGTGPADELRILYGGSVKPSNAAALFAQPDLDGFLVGGASLDPGSFLDIIDRSLGSRPAAASEVPPSRA